MKLGTKSTKSWAIYIGYSIVLTVALLYFLFPGNTIRNYVEQRVSDSGSGVILTIDKVRPAFPIGLQFLDGEISLRGKSDISPFAVERVRLFPRIGACLSGKGSFKFDGSAYKGEIDGSIRFPGYSISGPFDLDIHLEDVMLEEIASLRDMAGRHISGKLEGDITYAYGSGSFADGQGKCSFTVLNGSIEFPLPFLEPGGMQFLSMETVARLANGRLVFERCELEGDGLRCGLTGTITLYKNIEDSIINIRGDIEPLKASFDNGNLSGAILALVGKQIKKEKIPFAIRGTIRAPKVTFM
ncbi:MAG: type II secretion system protein GspN [Deltaproteobacteria bacterium]|nr:type II secretion system protein GspN [Deltaproteobacteria bacterium]